jgi:hypothetical protein
MKPSPDPEAASPQSTDNTPDTSSMSSGFDEAFLVSIPLEDPETMQDSASDESAVSQTYSFSWDDLS